MEMTINISFVGFLTVTTKFRTFFFFFNDTATTEIYTLSLHVALPIRHRTVPDPHRASQRRAREAHLAVPRRCRPQRRGGGAVGRQVEPARARRPGAAGRQGRDRGLPHRLLGRARLTVTWREAMPDAIDDLFRRFGRAFNKADVEEIA